MLRLYRYNMAYTFRKISTWVILGFLFLIMFSMVLLFGLIVDSIADSRLNTKPNVIFFINEWIMALVILPIIISISYISLKAANIFKDGEKDGTTLLLVSKPFTRTEVVFSKLLSSLTHAFFPALAFFLGLFIGDIFFDIKFMDTNIKYILSYALGIFVIDIIFMSISLLIASALGKTGTSILTMVSFMIIWILGGILPAIGKAGKAIPNSGYVYNLKNNEFDEAVSSIAATNNKNDKYKTYAYFDIWYQIASPFELMSNNPAKEYLTNVKPRSKDSEQKTLWEESTLTIGRSKYGFYIENGLLSKELRKKGLTSAKIKNIIKKDDVEGNITKTLNALKKYFLKNDLPAKLLTFYGEYDYHGAFWSDSKSSKSPYSSLYVWFKKHRDDTNIKIGFNKIKKQLTGKSDSQEEEIISSYMVDKNYGVNLLESFSSLKTISTSKKAETLEYPVLKKKLFDVLIRQSFYGLEGIEDKGFIKEHVEFTGKPVPYIAPWARSVIWITISLLMIGGVTIVYMRRDFK